MNKNKLTFAVLCAATLPFLALAAVNNPISVAGGPNVTINNITGLINSLLGTLWVIFAGIAVVCFVISGILFLTAGGQAEKITAARSAFIWGIAGVVVGIIAYSIITIVGNILG